MSLIKDRQIEREIEKEKKYLLSVKTRNFVKVLVIDPLWASVCSKGDKGTLTVKNKRIIKKKHIQFFFFVGDRRLDW